MDNTTKSQIISLIHQEVIPAIGCTEPVAVALAAAKAAEVLGCRPEKIEDRSHVNLSGTEKFTQRDGNAQSQNQNSKKSPLHVRGFF